MLGEETDMSTGGSDHSGASQEPSGEVPAVCRAEVSSLADHHDAELFGSLGDFLWRQSDGGGVRLIGNAVRVKERGGNPGLDGEVYVLSEFSALGSDFQDIQFRDAVTTIPPQHWDEVRVLWESGSHPSEIQRCYVNRITIYRRAVVEGWVVRSISRSNSRPSPSSPSPGHRRPRQQATADATKPERNKRNKLNNERTRTPEQAHMSRVEALPSVAREAAAYPSTAHRTNARYDCASALPKSEVTRHAEVVLPSTDMASQATEGIRVPMQVPQADKDVMNASLSRDGLLITIPHKIAAFTLCVSSSARAKLLGVVSVSYG